MNAIDALKKHIATASLESTGLSEFGKTARYFFLAGLYLHALKISPDHAAEFKKLMDRAHTFVNGQAMKVYRLPESYMQLASVDNGLLTRDADKLAGWFRNYIRDQIKFPADEKELFNKAVYLLRYVHINIPQSALDQMEKYAKLLSPKVGLAFANAFRLKSGTDSQFAGKQQIDSLYEQLQGIVKRLTGKTGLTIPQDRQKELKLIGGDGVRDLVNYTEIRKELKNLTTNALYVVLSNGNMTAAKAAKDMERMGFRDFPFPTDKDGYTGDVGLDQAGKLALFTTGGKQIQGLVAPNSKVTMNKKYNPELDDSYYFLFKAPNAVSFSRGYTTSFKQVANEEKHDKTTQNADKVGAWIKAAERDLFNKDPMRNVPAAVLMILYLTAGRIGSSTENQSLLGKAQTYGISTLRKEHAKVTVASIILDYNGKKGMHQRHTIKMTDKITKRIGVIVKRLLVGKKKGDLVFAFERPTSRTGAIQEVNPAFFRNYLKSIGVTINPHALRHIRGTELATQLLAKEWAPSVKAKTLAAKQREAETYMKEKILTQVANLLGHKSMKNNVEVPSWRTSITSYIHPTPIRNWFKQHHLAPPKWIPTKLED